MAINSLARSTLLLLLLPLAATADTPPDQQAAVVALRRVASNIQKNRDGTVRFIRFSRPNLKDADLIHLKVFKQLDYLAVVVPHIGDKGLAHVAGLSNLDTLYLSTSGITDAGMGGVCKGKDKLQRLYLDQTAIGDRSLAAVADLRNLTTLSLRGTRVTDAGLRHLSSLPELQVIDLSSTKVTDAGLRHLGRCAKLRVLILDDTSVAVADWSVFSGCQSLETLSLCGTDVTSVDPKPLRQLRKLRTVLVRRTTVTADSVARLKGALPKAILEIDPAAGRKSTAFERFRARQRRRSKTRPARPSADEKGHRKVDAATILPPLRDRIQQAETAPDFQRHVIPLLSRLGCSGRNCHGSFQGRGGFRLSMFGYDFAADHKSLLADDSPRVDRQSPNDSLIIQKPTLQEDHEGGKRFPKGGWEHQTLLRWIERGAPAPAAKLSKLLRLDISPREVVFQKQKAKATLRIVAVWADGTREDVTCLARFRTNNDAVAEVSPGGEVTSAGRGDTHVIVTYDSAVAAVPIMRPVSDLTGVRYPAVATPTEIDRLVGKKLRKLGIVPSRLSSDEEFLRRVSLDIIGTLPTPEEIRQFVVSDAPDKRSVKIEQLLARPEYVEWWSNLLADLTGSNAQFLGSTDMNQPAAGQWVSWIRRRVRDNVGWHEIAAGIILAQSRRPGQSYEDYALGQSAFTRRKKGADFTAHDNPMHYYWFRSNITRPSDRALSFGYIFLGVRLQCAQCHKHPFDRWSKDDFEQFTRFFARVRPGIAPDASEPHRRLMTRLGVPKKLNTAALRRQMYMRVAAEGQPIPWKEVYIQPHRKGQPTTARLLGGEQVDLSSQSDPREPLMEWLTRPDNPYFATAFVNRIWSHYFHRGIVHPPDDLNRANPATNRDLLDYLAKTFIARGYDMKWLHRTITNSHAYQRSWRANGSNLNDRRHFSHSIIRRLPAEVVIDSVLQATANDATLSRPNLRLDKRKIAQHPKSIQSRGVDYSLLVFGKPLRMTNCDCERQMQPSLLQSLYIRNDEELLQWLERSDGWLRQVASQRRETLARETTLPAKQRPQRTKATRPPNTKRPAVPGGDKALTALVRQAYLRSVSREPTDVEEKRSLKHLKESKVVVEGLRDLMWALLNTKEFQTNH